MKPYSGVFCFVVAVVEPTNGILGVDEVVVLYKPESACPVNVDQTWGRR